MTQQVEDEPTADVGVDRPVLDHEEKMALRSDRGDRGELGSVVVVPEEGHLANRSPGLADERNQRDRRFVGEDDGRPELMGFSLMVGQRVRTQA
jgi:hypothetical protein